jgi:SnoaL-like domain
MTNIEDLEAAVERLVAIEDIKQLKARYFRLMDQKKWDDFEKLFTPDMVFDLREALFARDQVTKEILKSGNIHIREDQIVEEAWLQRGAANVRRWEETSLAGAITVHQGHTPEIELTSPTTARAYWQLEHMHRYPNPIKWLPGNSTEVHEYHGYALYDESYEKQGGKWLIKALKLTHFCVDYS